MARRPSLRKQIETLIDAWEPRLKKAFLDSIDDIKTNADMQALLRAIKAKDINAVADALHIERAAFAPYEAALAQAYGAGGATTVAVVQSAARRSGASVVIRFDVRNPRAEQWLNDVSGQRITGRVIPDQLAAIRTVLEDGYAKGNGPRKIARGLIGDWNRATGRRDGGVLGLTNAQAEYVVKARSELLSGSPDDLRNYLTRNRRDRRFDKAIIEAIERGQPLDASTVSRATAAYESRLLQLRSEMVARTETMEAVMASQDEAFRQGLEKSGYSEGAVTRVWRSASDGRVRHTHAAMNGQEVRGLETPFVSPSGARMKFPGDVSLGAGPSEIIGCRCSIEYNIDFSEGVE
ncbi:hypothetical protein APY04_0831 [Hyphomicrobium sulfonivorans]|uniref:Phage head morphogenesis domain-containing protein n=1 Tax=Hyphomicrobium sulfonivorans TaxID=121290 RepID=A0A120CXD1_HYPSL|nr:phage minor head protein [Hyphomicrobium sulfonivorans]KWT70770.1 hypothetical protein APY04_0831 [Hyphomicrobium sulfonivorans]